MTVGRSAAKAAETAAERAVADREELGLRREARIEAVARIGDLRHVGEDHAVFRQRLPQGVEHGDMFALERRKLVALGLAGTLP